MATQVAERSYFRVPLYDEDDEERFVGRVLAAITVVNRKDEVLVAEGLKAQVEVRSVTIPDILVDTGASTLCLPANLIAELGLEYAEEVGFESATILSRARLFRDAHVFIEGRDDTFTCVEIPTGRKPLLGVIPLEALGLEPDLANQRLRVLPKDMGNTYFYAMNTSVSTQKTEQ
jgi:predicted aspartyl protease